MRRLTFSVAALLMACGGTGAHSTGDGPLTGSGGDGSSAGGHSASLGDAGVGGSVAPGSGGTSNGTGGVRVGTGGGGGSRGNASGGMVGSGGDAADGAIGSGGDASDGAVDSGGGASSGCDGALHVARNAALFFMVDQTNSLTADGPVQGVSKLTTLKNGVSEFVNDPASNGLGVGLGRFPMASGGACDGSGYDIPVVAIGALPGNAAPLSLQIEGAGGAGTPTEGALRGAIDVCLAYQQKYPTTGCDVVFITDGYPSLCDQSAADLTQVVAAAAAAGVKTFPVGLLSATVASEQVDVNLLDAIAAAGHADCDPRTAGAQACLVGSAADLTTALDLIRAGVTMSTCGP